VIGETTLDVACDIADPGLADAGQRRINWAADDMPVLRQIGERFDNERPLEGLSIAACLHVTAETANLMRALKRGGADVYLCASNPLSTQDDVAASLVVHDAIPVFAICGEDNDTYYRHLHTVLDARPAITMDDGGDLVTAIHTERTDLADSMVGGTEETTTGVIRLNALATEGKLLYPIVAVNDALTKHLFDNRYGTGQSTIDGIIRATNLLIAGRTFVVAGYGWCSRGVAMRARGMGANVVVTEVDELRALEAVMDGYRVMPMDEAATIGDIFVSATGAIAVLRAEHFGKMKDGAVVANSGHFNVEIDLDGLDTMAASKSVARPGVEVYHLPDGRKINVLSEGRLVNLAAAEGHPPGVMDMSFANQALAVWYLSMNRAMAPKVYPVPDEIDREVAALKLAALGVRIDQLTDLQRQYLASWELGT